MRLLVIALIILLSHPVNAIEVCRCKKRDFSENYHKSYSVFTGKVTKIRREFNPDRHRVYFNVYDSWKKIRNEEVSVFTSGTDLVALLREGVTCGYRFRENAEYLVMAYRDKNRKGPASVSNCGGTMLLNDKVKPILIEHFGEPLYSFKED